MMNTTNNSFSVEDVNILYTNARKILFAGIWSDDEKARLEKESR